MPFPTVQRIACAAFAAALIVCSHPAVAADARPISIEKLRQALAVSKLAAKNKLPELSLRAVRESLSGGPPVLALQFDLSSATGFSSSRGMSAEEQTYQQYVNEVEAALRELSAEWERQEFDPEQVFQTLTAVVLPAGRPTEVFLYPRSEQVTSSPRSATAPPTGSVGLLLVDWTLRAKAQDELKRLVRQRAESPRGKFDSQLLLVALAIQQGDPEAAAKDLAELQRAVKLATARTQSEAAGQVAWQALKHPGLKAAAVDVLEAAALNLQNAGAAQISLAAITRLQLGQAEAARATFQSFLAAHDAFYSRYSGDYPVRMRQQQLQSIAAELLKQNQLADALQLLGEHAELSLFDSASTGTSVLPLAASLARHLQTLSPQQRYDFLAKWSLPSSGGVRLLAGFLPTEKPPKEFFAALPERLRPHGFDLLATTPQPTVFHSGVALLEAAAEVGKLGELKSKLKTLADAKAANADVMLRLAMLIGPEAPRLKDELDARVIELEDKNQTQPKSGSPLKAVPLDDFVTALYAVRHPELRETGEKLIWACLLHAKRLQQPTPRVHIWMAYVEALLRRYENAPVVEPMPPGFRHWRPIDFESAATLSSNSAPNWWFAESGVVRNITAQGLGSLVFRYPLAGEFAFTAHVSEGNWSEGALLYGGLSWETYKYNNRIQSTSPGRAGARNAPGALLREGFDTRVEIKVKNGEVEYFVNGHRAFADQCGQTSPWLGLRSNTGYTPVFRSLAFTGRPQIPREVPLLENERLLGWSSGFYQETAPPVIAAPTRPTTIADAGPDWSFEQGVLTGRRRSVDATSTAAAPVESLFTYQRPLWDGEQLRYEFFYAPGKTMVHPALDRIAFLIEADRVRLHWLTEGTGDWTGLPTDNAVDDPQGQRSARALPFKPNDWNEMVVALKDNSVILRLNGTDIYARALPADAGRRFGFYHHREREEARVRNAVLSGDWPTELPQDLSRTLLAHTVEPSKAQKQTAQQLIDEEFLSREALHVVRQARGMPAAERWDLLASWVLPETGDVRIRTRGEFVAAYDPLAAGSPLPLVAPALLLVETARELNRLDALRRQVETIEVSQGSYNHRAQLALLTIIDMLLDRPELAAVHFQSLAALLPATTAALPTTALANVEWQRWPEILAGSLALLLPATRERAVLVFDHLVEQQIQKSLSGGSRFDHRVRMLRGLARQLAMNGGNFAALAEPLHSRDWVAVTHGKADTVAMGLRDAAWVRLPAGFKHVVGHEDDFLYFRTPLEGNFEVECELSGTGYRETQIMYGGKRQSMHYQMNQLVAGEFTTALPAIKLPQPYKTTTGWTPYKLTVKDGRMALAINGQPVYDEPLPKHADPWLAFHAGSQLQADVRHVRITGSPRVPEQLNLTAAGSLHGWIATYYREAVGSANNAAWTQSGDEIVGARRAELAGSGRESLLQYHRPLIEDGELTYRFHYQPGQTHVHPALGRTVFLLDREGVRIHDLTGGIWEASDLEPANVRTPENRAAHAGLLPLKAGEENELKLTLRDATLTLALNDATVYEGALPDDNNRIFGLFHWAGETEARVRNVVYRGNWPKSLHAPKDQEIAEVDPALFDTSRLTASWAHDFTQSGLGQNLFSPRGGMPLDQVSQVSPQGVTVAVTGTDGWREATLVPRRAVMGDFDIVAEFDRFGTDELKAGSAGVALSLTMTTPLATGLRVGPRQKLTGDSVLESQMSFDGLDGKKSYPSRESPTSFTAGGLRAVRRGPLIHTFYRDGEAGSWRYFDTVILGRAEYPVDLILLQVSSLSAGVNKTAVRWKSVAVHAEGVANR
jgi:hypothetical protein